MTKSLAKAIALATVLGASASAHAVNVNHDGLGQVLLYSLYTTEQNNDTNISVTNTSKYAKAVKVRFLEGQNSQEVLDFNLYLSPHDQWSGAITQTENGAKLVTFDRSCTAPAIPAGGVEFKKLQYKGDGGEQGLARTRVGHVEIIEMGDIDPAYKLPGTDTTLESVVTHNPNISGAAGTTADCNTLRAQFSSGGIWALGDDEEPSEELQTGFLSGLSSEIYTGGGLYGTATILNVNKSTQISYDAVAIDNFRNDALGVTSLHTKTGSLLPGLNSAVNKTAVFKNGEELTFDEGYEAVSALLMKKSISNDYVLDEGRLSETNWVITYPTKRFHVYNKTPTAAPFKNAWSGGKSCHEVALNYWDNEEYAGAPEDLQFSPVEEGQTRSLCYETNILAFNDSKMLGGEFVSYDMSLDQPDFQFGWMNVDFTTGSQVLQGEDIDENLVDIQGLPVIGFSAVTISNNIANDVMNNYGSSTEHKASTSLDH